MDEQGKEMAEARFRDLVASDRLSQSNLDFQDRTAIRWAFELIALLREDNRKAHAELVRQEVEQEALKAVQTPKPAAIEVFRRPECIYMYCPYSDGSCHVACAHPAEPKKET